MTVRQLGGETVVLDRSGQQIHQLNATASFIFASFDGQRTAEEVARRVAEHFDVEPSVAARDVADLVARLQAAGVLVSDPPAD